MVKKTPISEDRVFRAIGSGIQAFTLVEAGLSFLFSSLMRPAHGGMSILALDAARHIETKLRIVQAIGDARLQGDNLAEFKNLVNRISRKADTRHKLAHWAVGEYPAPFFLKPGEKPKVALLPPPMSSGYIKAMAGEFPPLQFNEIIEFDDGCRKLFRDLERFASRFPNIPTKDRIRRPPSRPLKAAPKKRSSRAKTKPLDPPSGE